MTQIFDNEEMGDVVWVVRHRRSSRLATSYNFEINGTTNGNDNFMLVVFPEADYHDAEISMDRHVEPYHGNAQHRWEDDWELVPVKLKEVFSIKRRI
jgi:hypothetical protein